MTSTVLTGFAFVAVVPSTGAQRVLSKSTNEDGDHAVRSAAQHARRLGPDSRSAVPPTAADCCWTVVESKQLAPGTTTASWCCPDAPPPFDMSGEQQAKNTNLIRPRWCCLQEVKWPSPAPSTSSAPVVRIFAVAVLTGARMKTVSGYVTWSCLAYARELANRGLTREHPVDSFPVPTDAVVGALEMLGSRPVLPDGSGPALSLDYKRNTTFAVAAGYGSSQVANAPAAVPSCFPHSDVPLEPFLYGFAYEQAQLLLSLLAQGGADAICFVSRHLSVASTCVAAALGLMYPLRWQGAIKPSLQRREALLCVQSLQDNDSVVLGTTCDAVPDLLLWVQSQPREQRRRVWIADCASGFVSLAAPMTDHPVELLPHDFDLKDTWKRHRVGVRPELSTMQPATATATSPQLQLPSSQSMSLAAPVDESAINPGEIPLLSQEMVASILTAACDLYVPVLGGYRGGLQKSMAGVSVVPQKFLAKALGATPGQPSSTGMPLCLAMLNAECIMTWAAEMAAFEDLWGIARMKDGAAQRWWVWRFVERCAEKYPDSFMDVASDKAKKASGGAFSMFSNLMKSAKQTVRSTVSGLPSTAPTHLEFLRVTSGVVGGKRCTGNELALALANAQPTPPADIVPIIKSAPRAAVLACNPGGNMPLSSALPHLEVQFARHYSLNGHCPLSLPIGGDDDIPPALRVSRGVPVLPLDLLGNFEEYQRLSQPPIMAQRRAPVGQGTQTAPPVVVAPQRVAQQPPQQVPQPQQAQSSPTPQPSATPSDVQARLRSVLDLSHLTGTPPPQQATPPVYQPPLQRTAQASSPPAAQPKAKSLDDFF